MDRTTGKFLFLLLIVGCRISFAFAFFFFFFFCVYDCFVGCVYAIQGVYIGLFLIIFYFFTRRTAFPTPFFTLS